MNKVMRSIILIIAFFLESCAYFPATYMVLHEADGIEIVQPSDVISAYFDNSQKEFVLCMTDSSSSKKNDEDNRFTLKIPEDIHKITLERFEITPSVPPKRISNVFYLSGKYASLDMLGTVTSGCSVVPNSFESVTILRTTKDVTFQEAVILQGKSIDTTPILL